MNHELLLLFRDVGTLHSSYWPVYEKFHVKTLTFFSRVYKVERKALNVIIIHRELHNSSNLIHFHHLSKKYLKEFSGSTARFACMIFELLRHLKDYLSFIPELYDRVID